MNTITENNAPLIELSNIVKSYGVESKTVHILKNIDLTINSGEYIGIVGKSGSGKSTILNILTAIDRPSEGEIVVNNKEIHTMGESAAAEWRGNNIGIIFQFFQLLPTLTVLDNVTLPMDFVNSVPLAERRKKAFALLEKVGMSSHAHKLPTALSGGEQQRVAIARSLANDPPIIVADEPTGNLDSVTSEAIHVLFQELADSGKTVIMVTHENSDTLPFSRVLTVSDGKIVNDEKRGVSC
ncbi:MAG: ABC transporter ATP-binding protein [Fibrobacterales bacterium]